MSILVRFMSLSGRFESVREERFATSGAALAAVKAYVEPHGFRDVQIRDDDPDGPDVMRFTATTPGGRGGRNVAFGDWDDGGDS